MFQEAESDPSLSQAAFKNIETRLRVQLVNAQYKHINLQDRALLILIAGIDGAGKGDTINMLNEWMDPRHIHTVAFPTAKKKDTTYPAARKFWMDLPKKGEIGIVFGSGYTALFEEAAKKKIDADTLENHILFVRRFEANLAANGIQILKLWFHLSRDAQKQHIEQRLANPSTSWQIDKNDLRAQKKFKSLRRAGQLIIEATDTPYAPWTIIPSADPQLRNTRTAQTILQALKSPLAKVPTFHDPAVSSVIARTRNPLDKLDYGKTVNKADYDAQILEWQNRLALAIRDKKFKQRSLALVFEGPDAAGKGGTIRRITRAIDARQFNIMPVAAPKANELAHPYLWRFWRNVPGRGRVSIFDRSWYGRVLVERVEKLITRASWVRAYDEINDFEQQLTKHGVIVLKFWLAITQQTQLERFREREHSPYKQFKITPDDWRNRHKWNAYSEAARDMFTHTNTPNSPWHIVPANDKRHARLEVLKQVVLTLEQANV